MSAATEVLLVEDDPFQRQMVQEYLSLQGLSVTAVADGAGFRRALRQRSPDLALLDVHLPDEDGRSRARGLRANGPGVGIIMLTAADELVDRVAGLECGADDYVTKPFEPRELLARVRAVLRRRSTAAAPAAGATAGNGTANAAGNGASAPGNPLAPSNRRVRVGAVLLDLDRQMLVAADGAESRLAAGEFELLRLLVENPNRPLHRDWLLETTAGNQEPEAFDRAIDLRIMRLRRKVERDPGHPEAIRTVRGIGYVFIPAGH